MIRIILHRPASVYLRFRKNQPNMTNMSSSTNHRPGFLLGLPLRCKSACGPSNFDWRYAATDIGMRCRREVRKPPSCNRTKLSPRLAHVRHELKTGGHGHPFLFSPHPPRIRPLSLVALFKYGGANKGTYLF